MPPIKQVEDQPVLVDTASFPFASWHFEKFNPVQSRVFEFYDQDNSAIIMSSTSSGKTTVAEMFMSHEIRKRGGKAMYLVPAKSLAQEKIDEWTDPKYHFKDKKISICTGDYRLTKDRVKELQEADIIIMTSETLSHRCRNDKSEQSTFLKNVGTLVVDESHLLGVPGRGDHLEVALMKFTEINPDARLVLLSATMPNAESIADWVSYTLTKKQTFLLTSKYRPVPLKIHYEPYCDESKSYDYLEQEKINKALDIVEWYKNDKFLIFTHSKRTGEMMKQALKDANVSSEFHNASLKKEERILLENNFKKSKNPRVLVATSTVAVGCNMPARRVIILGVHRGVQEIEVHEIIQMQGRSGRAGIDPAGDAYILVPESQKVRLSKKYSKSNKVHSQLIEKTYEIYKTLAFHLISEIHHGDVKNYDDVKFWFKRSLAYFQDNTLEESALTNTIEALKKCGAIAENNGEYTCRSIGKVSSLFYFSPFDVSNLFFNFKNVFDLHKSHDDFWVSFALGNIDSQKCGVVSKAEKKEMELYANKIYALNIAKNISEGALKAGFCYHSLLNGKINTNCAAFQYNLKQDFNRLAQVLIALDSFTGTWKMNSFFKALENRILHGVPAHLVEICRLPNIGKVRAQKLYDAGYKNLEQIANLDVDKLKKIINMKAEQSQQILLEAQKLFLL